MTVKINKTSFIAGAGSAVLLGAALIPGWAMAQTGDETATPEATAEATTEATPESGTTESAEADLECGPGLAFGFRLGGVGLEFSEDLAEALGVTTDDLEAAAETLREQFADTERPTTEEEAEALREEIKSALAAALNVTVEELEAAQEQLQSERQAEAIARIEEAVADGDITREQADEMIERIESGEGLFFGDGRGFRFGGFGEFGRFGAPFRFEGEFRAFPGGPFGDWDGDEDASATVTPDA